MAAARPGRTRATRSITTHPTDTASIQGIMHDNNDLDPGALRVDPDGGRLARADAVASRLVPMAARPGFGCRPRLDIETTIQVWSGVGPERRVLNSIWQASGRVTV